MTWNGPGSGMRAGGGYPSEKLWYWIFNNDPTFEDMKTEVADSIDHAKRTQLKVSTKEPEQRRIHKEREYDLLGSYLFPPVWVGERPKPTIHQLIQSGVYGYGYHSGHFTKIICEHETEGVRLISTQDGLIAIGTQDKRFFQDTFNILVAIMNLNGYDSLTVREDEIMYLDYLIGRRDELHPSLYESNKTRLSPWLHRSFLTPVIPTELLQKAFQVQATFFTNDQLKQLLLIFAEGYSHWLQREYSQSLLWNWIFIERWVSLKWEEYLNKQGVSRKLSDALNEIDISRNLRVLAKLGALDANIKNQLEKLRGLRNNIAHRGHIATKQEANLAIEISKKLISSLMSNK